jgi:hypothetical protein
MTLSTVTASTAVSAAVTIGVSPDASSRPGGL